MRHATKLHPALRLALGLATTASLAATGAITGVVFVRLFLPKRDMGWDAIADALGGLMVGALLGLVLGVMLAIYLAPRRQLGALAVAASLFAASWLTLYLTQPHRADKPGSSVGRIEIRPSGLEQVAKRDGGRTSKPAPSFGPSRGAGTALHGGIRLATEGTTLDSIRPLGCAPCQGSLSQLGGKIEAGVSSRFSVLDQLHANLPPILK